MRTPFTALLVVILSSVVFIACGQSSDQANASSIVIPPTSIKTQIIPTYTAIPENPTPTPSPLPSPTSTPEPTFTPVPTAFPKTNVDSYGFTLKLDGAIEIERYGLLGENPEKEDGIIIFEYEGASVTMLWLKESEAEELLYDVYTQLVNAQPELTFNLINQGSLKIDSTDGSYLSFISNTSTGEARGGGLTASWKCLNEIGFSLTVTGSDPVVLQIRFKRLLDGFTCN